MKYLVLVTRILTLYRKYCYSNMYYSTFLQAYIKIYQGEELPHPKSMLQVSYCLETGIIQSFGFNSPLPCSTA